MMARRWKFLGYAPMEQRMYAVFYTVEQRGLARKYEEAVRIENEWKKEKKYVRNDRKSY